MTTLNLAAFCGQHDIRGWVHWTDFTANGGATVGKGCGE